LLPSGGFFVHGLQTLALHGINRDSAGNYQLIDEESTRRILSADCQYSPSTGKIVIPPGITSSWNLIQTSKIKMCENPQSSNNFRISKFKSNILRRSTFLKFKYVIKMKNKPDPALSGGSYLFNEIKKGHQNLVRLSL
jgi:hypothetical protein